MSKDEVAQVQDIDYDLLPRRGRVRFEFPVPTKWLSFSPEEARRLSRDLAELADEAERDARTRAQRDVN